MIHKELKEDIMTISHQIENTKKKTELIKKKELDENSGIAKYSY